LGPQRTSATVRNWSPGFSAFAGKTVNWYGPATSLPFVNFQETLLSTTVAFSADTNRISAGIGHDRSPDFASTFLTKIVNVTSPFIPTFVPSKTSGGLAAAADAVLHATSINNSNATAIYRCEV
jgi:hypothetical protein